MELLGWLVLGLTFNDAVSDINQVVNQPTTKKEIVRQIQIEEGYYKVGNKLIYVVKNKK